MFRLLEHFDFEGEKIKGSRFIVNLFPIDKIEEAKPILHCVRKKHATANHHCHALKTINGEVRSSDDGEPRGSAGLPILRRVEAKDAAGLVVVVTRYFGGVKLGVGGLVRAYGSAAAMAMEKAKFARIIDKIEISVTCSYSDSGHLLSLLRNVEDASIEYGMMVSATVRLPLSEVDSFAKELKDRTSGRVGLDFT